MSKTSEEYLEPILLDLADRLRRRSSEIEKALVTRIRDLCEPLEMSAEVDHLLVHVVGMVGTVVFWGANPRAPIGG